MERIRPSEHKKQELKAFLDGGMKGELAQVGEAVGPLSEFIKLSVEKTLQEILEAEQDEYLGRNHYERNLIPGEERRLYRNGYEPAKLKTAEGVLEVSRPQVRGGGEPYRSELWERLAKTSEQLRRLITEMYVLGLSDRDVEEALSRSLGGFIVSKSKASQITDELYADYERFKERDLSGFDVAYLFIDAVYEPLRRYGSRTGIMCCWAYLGDGSRVLLDMTTSNSESLEACLDFLRGMVGRGLKTPLTITTDGAGGLIGAVDRIWPKSVRIRCWFHKMQNLEAKVPEPLWPEFKSRVVDIRDAPDRSSAEVRLAALLERWEERLPEACRCLRDDSAASLNHLLAPIRHRLYVRTTNLIERTFVEERRRTEVIPHLWDEKSLLKLVFGVLMRVSHRWCRPAFSIAEEIMIKNMRAEMFGENPPTDIIRPPKRKRSHLRVR